MIRNGTTFHDDDDDDSSMLEINMRKLLPLAAFLVIAVFPTYAQIGNGTVAGLPAAAVGNTNKITNVYDGADLQDCTVGGGALFVACLSTGSAWVPAFGPTNTAFALFIGPATTRKTFTLPNADSIILTDNDVVTVPQGGTGLAAGTDGGVLYFDTSTSVASSPELLIGMPVIGGGAGGSPVSATKTGDTTQFATFEGALTAGKQLNLNADGNIEVSAYDVGAAGGVGSGDVTAAANFGTDNIIVRSDGTSKGVQATGVGIDDSNNVTTPGGLTIGSAGTTPLNLTAYSDDVAPSAPGSANQFTTYIDRTVGRWAWIINGGSAQHSAIRIAGGTKALDTDAIASGACDTMTATATGVVSTDVISWIPNADITAVTGYAPVTTGGLAIYMWPSSDTVNIKVCNPTGSSITPGSAINLSWLVLR